MKYLSDSLSSSQVLRSNSDFLISWNLRNQQTQMPCSRLIWWHAKWTVMLNLVLSVITWMLLYHVVFLLPPPISCVYVAIILLLLWPKVLIVELSLKILRSLSILWYPTFKFGIIPLSLSRKMVSNPTSDRR